MIVLGHFLKLVNCVYCYVHLSAGAMLLYVADMPARFQ